MTTKEAAQFNRMLATLKKISEGYQSPSQLRKKSKGDFGLDYEEALEMAYENIQSDAKAATKGVKPIGLL